MIQLSAQSFPHLARTPRHAAVLDRLEITNPSTRSLRVALPHVHVIGYCLWDDESPDQRLYLLDLLSEPWQEIHDSPFRNTIATATVRGSGEQGLYAVVDLMIDHLIKIGA